MFFNEVKMLKIKDRKILIVSGIDSVEFLHQILTNNVKTMVVGELQYNLILTPQGKLLHDLFVQKVSDDCFMLDCYSGAIDEIISLFSKYKLGTRVDFKVDENVSVYWSTEPTVKGYKDPRHDLFSFRLYSAEKLSDEFKDFNEIHYELLLSQLYIDFDSGKYFPFDVGFDKFNSISFEKGCYIGQEVITRTHFRGVIRKKVCRLQGDFANGDEIFENERKVGVILGSYGKNRVLALMSFDPEK
jgi:folate-binding protein YgfZ